MWSYLEEIYAIRILMGQPWRTSSYCIHLMGSKRYDIRISRGFLTLFICYTYICTLNNRTTVLPTRVYKYDLQVTECHFYVFLWSAVYSSHNQIWIHSRIIFVFVLPSACVRGCFVFQSINPFNKTYRVYKNDYLRITSMYRKPRITVIQTVYT